MTIVEPGPLRTDFAAAAIARPPQSDDYVESVGKSLEWFESIAGRQPNDPDRVAAAIIEAVGSPQPPLRLALGEEAVEAVRQKLDGHRSELDAWEELGVTTAIGRDSHPILSWGRIATPRQDRTMKSDHPARLSAALPSRS